MPDPYDKFVNGIESGAENSISITLDSGDLADGLILKAIGCHASGSLKVKLKNDSSFTEIFVVAGTWKVGRFKAIDTGTIGTTAADVYGCY